DEPDQCMAEDLRGAMCRSVDSVCWKCEEDDEGCMPCGMFEECRGACVDGECQNQPCFGDDSSCDGEEVCLAGGCGYATSCKELWDAGYETSGSRTIDIDGDGGVEPFEVECVMEKGCGDEIGGWTKLSITEAMALGAVLDCKTQNSENSGAWAVGGVPTIDAVHGPHARHMSGSSLGHTCTFTFPFPYQEFAFVAYEIGVSCPDANCTIGPFDEEDIDWVQNWQPYNVDSGFGEIRFGPEAAPFTSVSALLGITEDDPPLDCKSDSNAGPSACKWSGVPVVLTTAQETCYSLPEAATSFRIGWGEFGKDPEGWAAWYGGSILLR
ncbi:MAG: hypothetical protein ACPG4T_23890, partial [Nannocystaceae bacterium]